MKRFVFAAALSVMLAGVSQAAILNTALRVGLNSLNDRDVARLIDRGSGVDPLTGLPTGPLNGLVDEGDQIETLLIIDNISNAQFGGTAIETAVGIPTYQLTAYTLNTVAAGGKVPAGPPGVFLFTFDPSVVSVYEDHAGLANTIIADFSSQTAAAAIAAGTDADLILTLDVSGTGFAGAPDVFRVIGSDDFSLLTTGNEANFIAALSIASNPGLIPISPDATISGLLGPVPGTGDLHDVVATGEEEVAAASIVAQGWDLQSDTTISFRVVPEPMSIVVWGALSSLVGLAIYRRRRND